MPRRLTYSKLEKSNQRRGSHVRGKGDTVLVGLSCLNPECDAFWFVEEVGISAEFRITCPTCGDALEAGDDTKFFDYLLTSAGEVIESGEFRVLHDDHVRDAPRFKYCILCGALKPLADFDRHAARRSGRQGECRLCKGLYNDIKNQTRTADQHREAANRRRLFRLLSGEGTRFDTRQVFDRFDGKCFNCGRVLAPNSKGDDAPAYDHTLPVKYLWPITTASATLLCKGCNNAKHDLWPSTFYKDAAKLRALSVRTGIAFEMLAGEPTLNPEAVAAILDDVDEFIESWVHYPEEIKKVRRLVLERTGVDIYDEARFVPDFLDDYQPSTTTE